MSRTYRGHSHSSHTSFYYVNEETGIAGFLDVEKSKQYHFVKALLTAREFYNEVGHHNTDGNTKRVYHYAKAPHYYRRETHRKARHFFNEQLKKVVRGCDDPIQDIAPKKLMTYMY